MILTDKTPLFLSVGFKFLWLAVVSCYSRDSGSIPQLVDIQWKLSYTASSASGDRYFEPWYFVTFILDRPASERYMAAKVSFIKGKR